MRPGPEGPGPGAPFIDSEDYMRDCSSSSTQGRYRISRIARDRLWLVLLATTTLGLSASLAPASAQTTVGKEVIAVQL